MDQRSASQKISPSTEFFLELTNSQLVNKNTKSDYCLQQRDFRGIFTHVTYVNAQNGKAYVDALPEIGYLPTYMSRESFSKNSVDIESALVFSYHFAT